MTQRIFAYVSLPHVFWANNDLKILRYSFKINSPLIATLQAPLKVCECAWKTTPDSVGSILPCVGVRLGPRGRDKHRLANALATMHFVFSLATKLDSLKLWWERLEEGGRV